MYIPVHYRNENLKEIFEFIRQNPFAILVSSGDAPLATHIPIQLVQEGETYFLEGHISKGNPQWKTFEGQPLLAIFSGPHTYVSSSWYNHVNVPTWNYMAVHVYGTITMQSEEEMRSALRSLVDRYEANSEKPVKVEEMPEDMMKKYLRGIVGFRMSMDRIEGKWKLSQNRDEEDYRNIIKELERVDEVNAGLIAGEMKKRSR